MDKEWNIRIAGLKESAKDFDSLKKSADESKQSLENQNKTVGDYSKAIREMSKEIKTIQGEMLGLEKGSKQWTMLAQKAGEYKDRIDDIREATKRYASDTKNLDDVINLARSATASFTLYKGAMSAFGMETEKAEQALTELAGAMSIIQSLQTLNNTLKGSSATAELFNTVMKATGAELVQTQIAAIKATAAQDGLSSAQKAGAVASKTLGLALKAIPLMLVIGLVATLITHWQDIVGWFEKTFPILNKMGGAMNALKGVITGVGKAVVHWLINPFETFAKVIKRIMAGDFAGAVEEAINGVKNQFTGLADSFKQGFQSQIETGMEEMSRKAAAEMDKTLTHQKNMITKQKNADGTYRKEYIDANKKMFENRKKMYKKDSDEYRKVLEEEAQFYQSVEDAKTTATKKAASDRVKANKEAAAAAKKAAEEEAKKLKELKEFNEKANKKLYKSTAEYLLQQKALEIELANATVERYKNGPVEKYIEAIEVLNEKLKEQEMLQRQSKLYDFYDDAISNISGLSSAIDSVTKKGESALDTFMTGLNNIVKKSQEYGKTVSTELFAEFAKENKIFKNLTTDQFKYLYGVYIDYVKDGLKNREQKEIETQKKIAQQTLEIHSKTIKNINARLSQLQGIEAPNTASIYDRILNPKKAKEDLEAYKIFWALILNEAKKNEPILVATWDSYLKSVKDIYGKDSEEFIKACEEKKKALKDLKDFQEKAEKGVKGADVSEKNMSSINTKEARTDAGGNTNWKALWSKENTIVDNLLGNFELLDEMVLAPAMDTFSMFMDFALEETAQKLEQVQEMHDKAMDKVNESADKIEELNESLRDSGNDNMEATKQQLADEQLLYAQRLAEERKLADEEKNLKNKQAQQEANARKMELRYQMVMAIANTAQGASKALAQWGWPLGSIFAGVMAALGAVQVGLIAKQIGAVKPVKYAEGGTIGSGIVQGKPHSLGGARIEGTNIEVEGGEMVVSKRNTERYKDVLQLINRNDPSVRYLQGNTRQYADTKIRKYASGGELNFDKADDSLRTQQETSRLISAINGINMNPIVTVKDIWRAEDRLVKVRGLAGR